MNWHRINEAIIGENANKGIKFEDFPEDAWILIHYFYYYTL